MHQAEVCATGDSMCFRLKYMHQAEVCASGYSMCIRLQYVHGIAPSLLCADRFSQDVAQNKQGCMSQHVGRGRLWYPLQHTAQGAIHDAETGSVAQCNMMEHQKQTKAG